MSTFTSGGLRSPLSEAEEERIRRKLERRGASHNEIQTALDEAKRRALAQSEDDPDSVLDKFGIRLDGGRPTKNPPAEAREFARGMQAGQGVGSGVSALGGHVEITDDGGITFSRPAAAAAGVGVFLALGVVAWL